MTLRYAHRKKCGEILNPYKVDMDLVEPEEKYVANLLIKTGYDVTFLPKFDVIKYPDIVYRGIRWEIKSPKGSSTRHTIDNNLREALEQSVNVIINLQRIKIKEENCIRTLKRQFAMTKKMKRLMVITKGGNIIEF